MPRGAPKPSKISEHVILSVAAGVATALVLAMVKLGLDKSGKGHISKRM